MDARLFTQLAQDEIKTKEALLKQKIEKYKTNIYYTVGDPIQISESNTITPWLSYTPRNSVSDDEIYNSFPDKNSSASKLFSTEKEALEYSRFLRIGNQFLGEREVYQPAIFKVIYLGNTKELVPSTEMIVINANSGHDNKHYDDNERSFLIEYRKVLHENIVPQEGSLKIQFCEKDNFRLLNMVLYDELGKRKAHNFLASFFRPL